MLGHELRNPLASIQTAVALMKLRGDDTFARERTIIERQVQHLTRLVEDLFDVSRIAQGKVELRIECLELYAGPFPSRGIRLVGLEWQARPLALGDEANAARY